MMSNSLYLDMDTYQHEALKTLKHGSIGHLTNGLFAEAGEVAALFQKWNRKDPRYLSDQDDLFSINGYSEEFRASLYKELGDVLWYTACLAEYFGFPLSSIAAHNIHKLQERQKKGTIQGNGDER